MKKKKRDFKNDANRSRLIFSTPQLMKGEFDKSKSFSSNMREISEKTRRNGQKGVCPETVRKFYLPINDHCAVNWPSSRTLESIIYSLGGKITVERRNEPED